MISIKKMEHLDDAEKIYKIQEPFMDSVLSMLPWIGPLIGSSADLVFTEFKNSKREKKQ